MAYNLTSENLAPAVAILDTEQTDNDALPRIPSLNRLQTQPILTDRQETQGQQTHFSNALKTYKMQKEAFK